MKSSLTAEIADKVKERGAPGGGFEERKGGGFRPDATAWAVLALSAAGVRGSIIEDALDALAARQGADGRLALSPEHPDVFWPTAPGILAWNVSPRHQGARDRAVRFLLGVSGVQIEAKAERPYAHDPSLRGWPWTESTFSWVEPTSLALIALKVVGETDHARIGDAVRLLLDRQLGGGGWNYGNTVVFDQVLTPMVGPTGMALQALAGMVKESDVAASLDFLESSLPELRTPFSLGWAILGLGAWGVRLPGAGGLISESLTLESRYGSFGTVDLSLLALANSSAGGLLLPL